MHPLAATPGVLILTALLLVGPAAATPDGTAPTLFQNLCAECHGADRLGAIGPALIPETLGRVKPQDARKAILEGRSASQMPAFADRLGKQETEQLVAYIFTPLWDRPRWDIAKMHASHRVLVDPSSLPAHPLHGADPMNLFVVANYLPHTLVILDANDLSPIKLIPVEDGSGKSSRVSAVYSAPPRQSFVAALKDIPELWEIVLADDPLPVYNGPMHDYRLNEGTAQVTGRFPARRVPLDDYLDDFFFDPTYRLVIGAARNAKNGQVIHLDVRRKIAELELDGMPHLGSGITWEHEGRAVLATPHLKKPEIAVVDMETWETVKRIETLGPGFFMRSHENTPYAWVDVFFGPNRDALHVIDKRTLEIVKTLRPTPGKTAAHVEFDRHGRYALVSVWDIDGALVVYDAETFEEVKRLPMKKPSGKYNVFNKIARSAGTSH